VKFTTGLLQFFQFLQEYILFAFYFRMLFKCGTCNVTYTTSKGLKQHMRDKHGGRQNCPYEGCTYTYAQSRLAHLSSHMEKVHRVMQSPSERGKMWKVRSVVAQSKPPCPTPGLTVGTDKPVQVDYLYGFSDIPSPERIELGDEEVALFHPLNKIASGSPRDGEELPMSSGQLSAPVSSSPVALSMPQLTDDVQPTRSVVYSGVPQDLPMVVDSELLASVPTIGIQTPDPKTMVDSEVHRGSAVEQTKQDALVLLRLGVIE